MPEKYWDIHKTSLWPYVEHNVALCLGFGPGPASGSGPGLGPGPVPGPGPGPGPSPGLGGSMCANIKTGQSPVHPFCCFRSATQEYIAAKTSCHLFESWVLWERGPVGI